MLSKWLSSYFDCKAQIRSLLPFNDTSDTFFLRDMCTKKKRIATRFVTKIDRLISVNHRAKSLLRLHCLLSDAPRRGFIKNSQNVVQFVFDETRREFATVALCRCEGFVGNLSRGELTVSRLANRPSAQLSFKFSHKYSAINYRQTAQLRDSKTKNKQKY